MAVFLFEVLLQWRNLDGPKWKNMPAPSPYLSLRAGYEQC